MEKFHLTEDLELRYSSAYVARHSGGHLALLFVEFLLPYISFGSISRTVHRGKNESASSSYMNIHTTVLRGRIESKCSYYTCSKYFMHTKPF